MLIVKKFGGSSVANKERIFNVLVDKLNRSVYNFKQRKTFPKKRERLSLYI